MRAGHSLTQAPGLIVLPGWAATSGVDDDFRDATGAAAQRRGSANPAG